MPTGQAVGPILAAILFEINIMLPYLYILSFEILVLLLNLFVYIRKRRENGPDKIERSFCDLSLLPLPEPAQAAIDNPLTGDGKGAEAKTIHFIRHGHSTQNEGVESIAVEAGFSSDEAGVHAVMKAARGESFDPELQKRLHAVVSGEAHADCALTDKGFEQAMSVRSDPNRPQDWELVVSSSLRRTIQTAHGAFGDLLAAKGQKMLLVDCAREINTGASAQRPNVSQMQARDGRKYGELDYSLLEEDDPIGVEGLPRGDQEAAIKVDERALETWDFLMKRPEQNIVCVSHQYMLTRLLEHTTLRWVGPTYDKPADNCEIRSFEVSPAAPNGEGVLYDAKLKSNRKTSDTPRSARE